MTSQGSSGGRSQGARKRKAIADADAEKAKAEKERDELRGALDIQLGTGTRRYASADRTGPSSVKRTTATRVLRPVPTKQVALPQEHDIDLHAEESVTEQVVMLLAHQAEARAGSSPETRKMIRQSPRRSAYSLTSLQAVK